MRIAVMGAGGVGGYFGGLLAAAGNDVTFLARGAHLQAMRANGLRIVGPRGDTAVKPVQATDDPAQVGPVDVVLFTVKLYDTESAGAFIGPVVGPDTAVVSLQNGVDGPERLAAIYGAERVMGGAAYVAAHIAEPGVISYTSDMSSIVFGAMNGEVTDQARALAEAGTAAGFGATATPEIEKILWTKFLLLATNASLTCLARRHVAQVYADPDLRATAIAAMEEIVAVAKVRGIALDDDAIDKACALSDTYPPEMTTSMHRDLMAGRRLEVASLSGYVVRAGAEAGVPTPVHRTCWAALKPHMDGAA